MALAKSPQRILHCLKSRGPQSVRILARQLDMTTMGVRQHLADMEKRQLVVSSQQARQTRGRPLHLWKLTETGHRYFPDSHAQITLELLDVLREDLGEAGLNQAVSGRNRRVRAHYTERLANSGADLQAQIQALAELRSQEGYMAEVRLLPEGWLLIENHCPILAAASNCQQFCRAELELFQQLLADRATVERTDHLLAGARRCAYKITPLTPTTD